MKYGIWGVLLKYVDTVQFIYYNERNITTLHACACAHIHTSCFFKLFCFSETFNFPTEALSICIQDKLNNLSLFISKCYIKKLDSLKNV